MSPRNLSFHLEQLQADDELQRVVGAIAADLLGGTVALEFEAGKDGDDASDGASAEPSTAPDPSDLLEDGADATDPTSLVVDILGGEVISE